MNLSRRDFLKATAVTGGALAAGGLTLSWLRPAEAVDNPLALYPTRDWEELYRDQYRYDSSFTFVCSPNDTHACRLRAYVRNGVFLRTEANYDVGRYKDLYGNSATDNWGPRTCLKGYTVQRRVYGPYRLRYPIMRKGWKQWADDGFPELTPENKTKYKFDSRGSDEFLRASWDEAFTYASKGILHIAKTYSGPLGREKLLAQGYTPEAVDTVEGAGTRTMKFRGGMGFLGVIGKYGMYRFTNTLALVDCAVRGVPPEEAKAGRIWDNYTWHGDQAPGHPFVHGLQTSECDMNDLRSARLHIQMGKNLVENKLVDSHWFIELMERGGKIVVVAPEYNPPATKANYWIPVRPNSDAALLLGVSKLLIDTKRYDEKFLKRFSDMPLLVRTDTLKRLDAKDVFPDYKPFDLTASPSMEVHGLTKEQRDKLPDYVVWDAAKNAPAAISRDHVGDRMEKAGIDPALEGTWKIKLVDGTEVEVKTLLEMYKIHLADYDLDTVAEITRAPKELMQQLADDLATIKPAAIHIGEGINHWFHATEVNRATYLPLILTGNIGERGAGSHTWAGNYKAGVFQGSHETGPGFGGWITEDPFHPSLDETTRAKDLKIRMCFREEAVAYWNYGDKPLVVDTPKFGRKVFTGKTHMPSPTKVMWFTNVNLINNAKWAYEMIKNVDPNVELIMSNDIEMTASIEYSDFAFPANSWAETKTPEITGSCSNPFIQIWKGGIEPLYDSKDDVMILAGMASKLGELLGDPRFNAYWKFALEGRPEVYIDRLLDGSITMQGYTYADVMAGKYGEPGAFLYLSRTYPRVPFWEQIHESMPFFTPTGRLQAYNDEPEVIEYGENFIVHREGPEATPYLPNVIVSNNPYVRPEDYGIPPEEMDPGARQVRNIKMPWSQVKTTKNPLWEKGYQFFAITPKTRHRVHSSWSTVDWHLIWDSNFGDPYRVDKRAPYVGEHQLHMNPQAARDLGINDGDYVYVDANPADRPYMGASPNDAFYKVARLMLRVKYNPAYPYNAVMSKHAPFIATERSVKAHESRPDGRALSEGTGYQADLRYGSQQSLTRGWLMPMHQLDSLFHKSKSKMKFVVGCESDNHMINTVPKETLVRITKAEDGGIGAQGIWQGASSGMTPDNESDMMRRYMTGDLTKVNPG